MSTFDQIETAAQADLDKPGINPAFAARLDSDYQKTRRFYRFGLYMLGIGVLANLALFLMTDGWPTSDVIFAIFIFLAACWGYWAENVINNIMLTDGYAFFTYGKESRADADKAFEDYYLKVWRVRTRMIGMALYGGQVIVGSFIIGAYEIGSLDQFMFSYGVIWGNLVAGMTVGSFVMLMGQFLRALPYVKVSIWELRNPSTMYFIELGRRLALTGTPYVALGVTAAMFAPLQVGVAMVYYFAASITLLLMAIVLPYVPIIARARQHQERVLDQLNQELSLRMTTLDALDTTDTKTITAIVGLEKLVCMKEEVENLTVFPMKTKTYVSLIYISISALLPVGVQAIAEIMEVIPQ